MEVSSGPVSARQRDQRAAERADQHSADSAARVAVLAQDVADARALARPCATQRGGRKRFLVVQYHQIGVVLDLQAGVDGAHQVVGLLS